MNDPQASVARRSQHDSRLSHRHASCACARCTASQTLPVNHKLRVRSYLQGPSVALRIAGRRRQAAPWPCVSTRCPLSLPQSRMHRGVGNRSKLADGAGRCWRVVAFRCPYVIPAPLEFPQRRLARGTNGCLPEAAVLFPWRTPCPVNNTIEVREHVVVEPNSLFSFQLGPHLWPCSSLLGPGEVGDRAVTTIATIRGASRPAASSNSFQTSRNIMVAYQYEFAPMQSEKEFISSKMSIEFGNHHDNIIQSASLSDRMNRKRSSGQACEKHKTLEIKNHFAGTCRPT
jgi:hypothetical protein